MVNVEEIRVYLNGILPGLGMNKQRELSRLIYEISKRDRHALSAILPAEKNLTFERAKKYCFKNAIPLVFPLLRKMHFICRS